MDPAPNGVDPYLAICHPEEQCVSEGTHCPRETMGMNSRRRREWSALVPGLRPEERNVSGQS